MSTTDILKKQSWKQSRKDARMAYAKSSLDQLVGSKSQEMAAITVVICMILAVVVIVLSQAFPV